MRAVTFFSLLIFGTAVLIVLPAVTTGQPGGFGKKGGGSGGSGAYMSQDPGAMFDMLSKNRGFFLISETRMLRDPLTQYAKDKGIMNGQISRQQFVEYMEQAKAKLSAGAPTPSPGGQAPPAGGGFSGFGKGKKGDFGGGPPAMQMNPAAPLNADALKDWAESEFKRRDNNGDGKLNQDEMPDRLRGALASWDKNRDGFVDFIEYREYFNARLQSNEQDQVSKAVASIIIEVEELDRKPVVFRAGGAMPANLPSWFKELDIDVDGQVALSEWHKARKNLDDFKQWDLNDDGYITPEEAVRQQVVLAKSGTNSSGSQSSSESPQFGGKGGMGKGFPGGGKGGKKGERPN